MNRLCAFIFWILFLTMVSMRAEDEMPRPYPLSRYELIWKKAPFTIASVASGEATDFTENLAFSGVVKIGQESYVAVVDKVTQKGRLISKQPDEQGLKLVRIEFADDLSKLTVILEKDGKIGTLHFVPGASKIETPVAAESEETEPSQVKADPQQKDPKAVLAPAKGYHSRVMPSGL